MDQQNGIHPSLIPDVTFGQFTNRMAQKFVDLVADLQHTGELFHTLTSEEFGAHLVGIKHKLFSVTCFLVENSEFIDETPEWFDAVEEHRQILTATFSSEVPSQGDLQELLDRTAIEIAELFTSAYSMHVDHALRQLRSFDELVDFHDECAVAAYRENQHLILDLQDADCTLLLYMTDPSSRLALHDEYLPVFYPYDPESDFPGYPQEDGDFLSVINYDHLVSFTVAMCNAFSRGNSMDRISEELVRRNGTNIRPFLIALYEDLPNIVELLDGIMFERFPMPYNTAPFTERLEHWATRGVSPNRPIGREHKRKEDFVASLYEVEFGDVIYGMKEKNPKIHPFSPITEEIFSGRRGRHIDVALRNGGCVRRESKSVSVSAREANYMWGDKNVGIALVLSAN